MINKFEEAGLQFVGKDETGRRMEIVEIPEQPYFVGVQFHPEFKSRPGRPTPVFLGFLFIQFIVSSQVSLYRDHLCHLVCLCFLPGLILAASGGLASYLQGHRTTVLSGLYSSPTGEEG